MQNIEFNIETPNQTALDINTVKVISTTTGTVIVETLPTTGEDGIIYMVPAEVPTAVWKYDKYMWINNAWDRLNASDQDVTALIARMNTAEANITNLQTRATTAESNITNLQDRVSTNESAITTINSKIPSAATSSNQLADKDFVNSSVENVAAYYITKDAAGNAFETKAELDSTTVFYSGGEIRDLTRNDYTVVLADETHTVTETGKNPTCRYIWTNTPNNSTGQWSFLYVVNNNGLTSDLWKAVNSGITDTLVTKLNSVETGALVNKLEGIKVNGTELTITDKKVNIEVPEAFVATKNVTTYSEITLAISAGRAIFAFDGSKTYSFDGNSNNAYYFSSLGTGTANSKEILKLNSSNNWTQPTSAYFLRLGNYTTNTGFGLDLGTSGLTNNDTTIATSKAIKNYIDSNYLTSSSAAATYLTKSEASSTYLSQTSASSTYLTQESAEDTYLSQTDAGDTYVPYNKSGAETIKASGNITILSTADNVGLAARLIVHMRAFGDNSTYKAIQVSESAGAHYVIRSYDSTTLAYTTTTKYFAFTPTTLTLTIASSSWTALSDSSPYTYSATVSGLTIGSDATVRLVNDQAVNFATYGFAIGSATTTSVTIYSVGAPTSSVTLKAEVSE